MLKKNKKGGKNPDEHKVNLELYRKEVIKVYEDGKKTKTESERLNLRRSELEISEKEANKIESDVRYPMTPVHKLFFVLLALSTVILMLANFIFVIIVIIIGIAGGYIWRFVGMRSINILDFILKNVKKRNIPVEFTCIKSHLFYSYPENFREKAIFAVERSFFPTLFIFFLMSTLMSGGELKAVDQGFIFVIVLSGTIITSFTSAIYIIGDSSLMLVNLKKRTFIPLGYKINDALRSVGGTGAIIAILGSIVNGIIHKKPEVLYLMVLIFVILYPMMFISIYVYNEKHFDFLKNFEDLLRKNHSDFAEYEILSEKNKFKVVPAKSEISETEYNLSSHSEEQESLPVQVPPQPPVPENPSPPQL